MTNIPLLFAMRKTKKEPVVLSECGKCHESSADVVGSICGSCFLNGAQQR